AAREEPRRGGGSGPFACHVLEAAGSDPPAGRPAGQRSLPTCRGLGCRLGRARAAHSADPGFDRPGGMVARGPDSSAPAARHDLHTRGTGERPLAYICPLAHPGRDRVVDRVGKAPRAGDRVCRWNPWHGRHRELFPQLRLLRSRPRGMAGSAHIAAAVAPTVAPRWCPHHAATTYAATRSAAAIVGWRVARDPSD